MVDIIETERLWLRPIEKNDVDRIFLLDSNPEVMKYIGVPVVKELHESEKVIDRIQKQYIDYGIGRFAVIEKATNLLIGWSGLKYLTETINDHINIYDLGYRFLPEFWGKGYATEAAKPFVKLAFEELKLEKLYAMAHAENIGSNKILQKLGFQQNGTFAEHDGICNWYEMDNKSFKYKF